MSELLKNKVAVVTGGGSGIGEAICRRFAGEGAHVCLLDFNEEEGSRVVEDIRAAGGTATFFKADVSEDESIQSVFASILNGIAPVDVLVNNAGVASIGDVESCSAEELDRVYGVNVRGTANCLRAAVGQMKGRGGAIVNIASIASHVGLPDRFAYSMSKGAVLTMSLSVAADYVDQGIRCNTISPARIHTPFVDGFVQKNYPGQEEATFAKLAASQPIGRMGQPSEVAALVLYLCSDQAAFITGSDFPIDGGYVKLKEQ